MVYRDLSYSLAAHAALAAALLAFSATRQAVRVPEVVRPVRLMTSLELPAASPAPAARPAMPAPSPAPTPKPLERPSRPRAAETALPPPASTPVKTVAPIAIPKFVIPTGPPAPAAPARTGQRPAATTALRDRLASRLSAPPEETRTATETAAPRIASLPPPEAPTVPPRPTPVPATAVATAGAGTVPPGSVQPVGFFPHAWYLAVLKERVFSRWAPPSEFFGTGRVTALVSFRIDRTGRVDRASIKVKEGSGHARFDRSALAAIQGLAQVPALPEQYTEETLDVVIRFQNE